MSAARVLRPRGFRPQLSTRYQHLHRHQSTIPPQPPQTAAPIQSVKRASFFSRYRARIIWATLSLAAGLTAGNLAVHVISPPAMPTPGSHEDDILLADLNKRIDEEFKVKVLRGKCLGVAKQLKGEEGGWVEIVPSTPDTTSPTDQTTTPLLNNLIGARGLGVERIFWNRAEHRLVAVVYFGSALSGWPGKTHGGLLATILSEKLSLANTLAHTTSQSPTATSATPQRLPGTGTHARLAQPDISSSPAPTQLALNYLKPTYANTFHVIRVSPAHSPAPPFPDSSTTTPNPPAVPDESTGRVRGTPIEPAGAHDWEATLETTDTRICVKANAKFEGVGSGVVGAVKEVEGVVGRRYEEFRRWLWPSRQERLREVVIG